MIERDFLEPVTIDAFDVDDAWFQCLSKILAKGHVYTITRGSYAGQRRLEFDFVACRGRFVQNPGYGQNHKRENRGIYHCPEGPCFRSGFFERIIHFYPPCPARR